MTSLHCKICQQTSLAKAYYCYHCGNQLRCKICDEELADDAEYCVNCGTTTAVGSRLNAQKLNTLKFKESKEECYYEIEFTNDVGKEIKEVVADLLKTKSKGTEVNKVLINETNAGQLDFTEIKNFNTDIDRQKNNEENLASPAYPHLDDLEMILNCQENEWLMIFAFYNSNFGAKTFSKNEVWDIYKAKRKTETRFKNLGTNWKSLFKKYISTVKENEFKFTAAGLSKIKDIISNPGNGQTRRTGAATKPKLNNPEFFTNTARNIPPSRKVVANSIVQEEFDVYRNDTKDSLENFFRLKMPGSGNPNRIVTIAYYITKINQQEYFTEGNLDYAYRILHLSGKPVHLKQVIINLKNDRIWFQRVKAGNRGGWKLTRQGEIYVEEKLPPKF